MNQAPLALPSPAALVELYGPLVSSICRKLFSGEEEARDAAQEAWEAVIKGLPGYRGEASLSTWIYTVVYRRLLRLRQEGRRERYAVLLSQYRGPDFAAPAGLGPERELWARETCRECMRGLLFCLEPRARLVFLFRVVAGLDYADIAAIMDSTEEAARQGASRARRLVARFLREECAYGGPEARCRCRNERWVREFGLAEEEALRRVATMAERFRVLEAGFPPVNYWLGLLEGEAPKDAPGRTGGRARGGAQGSKEYESSSRASTGPKDS